MASYYKAFPSAGIDFLLNIEGMGKDMMAPSATYFVKHGSMAPWLPVVTSMTIGLKQMMNT